MTWFAFAVLAAILCVAVTGACQLENGNCQDACEIKEPSYRCECFYGYDLDSSKTTCIDVNECDDKNGGCSDICTNNIGSYKCSCNPGYILGKDGRTCEDLDECLSTTDNCDHYCYNDNGTYSCQCKTGFTLNSDGKTCDDINECATGTHSCNRQSQYCYNWNGGYTCFCNMGYTLSRDKQTCEDVNECSWYTNCNHECYNTPGSFQCRCRPGYKVSPVYSYRCEDIDECRTRTSGCSEFCKNTEGSYICSCIDQEYYKVGSDGKTCGIAVGIIPEDKVRGPDCVSGWKNDYGWRPAGVGYYVRCSCTDFDRKECPIIVTNMKDPRYKCGRWIKNGDVMDTIERGHTFIDLSRLCYLWRHTCKDGVVYKDKIPGQVTSMDSTHCP